MSPAPTPAKQVNNNYPTQDTDNFILSNKRDTDKL